ncbi:hypothetical protein JXA32_10100 [Candidatus Sumerlaeota bacterium]|nr:hypothetical protein [Candidatus Sumerlaeota bacterium]
MSRNDLRLFLLQCAILALVAGLFHLPALTYNDGPVYSSPEAALRHLRVATAQLENAPEGLIRVMPEDAALRQAMGHRIAALLTWLATLAALIGLLYVFRRWLTELSGSTVANAGGFLFVLQGGAIGRLSGNFALTLGVLGLLGLLRWLWKWNGKPEWLKQKKNYGLLALFAIFTLALHYQTPFAVWVVFPLLALCAWRIAPRSKNLMQRGLPAIILLAIPAVFLATHALFSGALFAPSISKAAAVGVYNGFNAPDGSFVKGMALLGRGLADFWLNALAGLPLGRLQWASMPLLAVLAVRPLLIRTANADKPFSVFTTIGLLLLILPFLGALQPEIAQSAGHAPAMLLLTLFAVMGLEQYAGIFGQMAQRIFIALCSAMAAFLLAFLPSLTGEWNQGYNEQIAVDRNVGTGIRSALMETDTLAATLFHPALLNAPCPILPLTAFSAQTPHGAHRLEQPAQRFAWFYRQPDAQRPTLIFSGGGDWPSLNLFKSFVALHTGAVEKSGLMLLRPDWDAISSGRRPWRSPGQIAYPDWPQPPEWTYGLDLVDELNVGDLIGEAEHLYASRDDSGTARVIPRTPMWLLRKPYPQSKVLEMWDCGRQIHFFEEFQLRPKYGNKAAVLVLRSDTRSDCMLKVNIGGYQKEVFIEPDASGDFWKDYGFWIPPGKLQLRKDVDGVEWLDVRVEVEPIDLDKPYQSAHYWFYQTKQDVVENEE